MDLKLIEDNLLIIAAILVLIIVIYYSNLIEQNGYKGLSFSFSRSPDNSKNQKERFEDGSDMEDDMEDEKGTEDKPQKKITKKPKKKVTTKAKKSESLLDTLIKGF